MIGDVKNGSLISGWTKWRDEGIIHQDADSLGESRKKKEERKR